MDLDDDLGAELEWWVAVEDANTIARMIQQSGREQFGNLLARVQEAHPGLTSYEQQVLVKKELLLRHPDGERLWEWWLENMSPEFRPRI